MRRKLVAAATAVAFVMGAVAAPAGAGTPAGKGERGATSGPGTTVGAGGYRAATTMTLADPAGDVGSPSGDIFGTIGIFQDGVVSLGVGTFAQTDPTFPAWLEPSTFLVWDLYVDGQDDVDANAWLFTGSDGDIYAYVEDVDTGAACDAAPTWGALEGGQGFLGLTFLGSCAGATDVIAAQAHLAYEEGGRTMRDVAPDDTALLLENTVVAPPVEPTVAPPSGGIEVGAAAASTPGYWMLGGDGTVWGFGPASSHTGGRHVPAAGHQAAAIASTPSGAGYWVLDSDGAIHASGDAAPHPPAAMGAFERATSLSVTPDGAGLWIFTSRGRVITRGTAQSFGDASGLRLNGPILGSVATPTGRGYYLVGSDGGVFSYGDARFAGSMGGTRLNAAVNGLVPDPDGLGYWLVASDGGVFAFDAAFRGAMPPVRLNQPVVGMVAYGGGYLMVAADGGIFNFSDDPFHGSLGASPPAVPVVAVASQATSPAAESASYQAAARGWNRLNRDNDRWYDGWFWDGDGDGLVEYLYLDDDENGVHEVVVADRDENGRIDTIWADANQNGRYEGSVTYHYQGYGGNYVTLEAHVDSNEDGRFEVAYYDGDRDQIWEWVKHDTNGDGVADQWVKNSAPSGRTAADAMARNVAAISAVNILHGAGIPVFFP